MAAALSFPCALDTATKQFHLLSSVLSGIIACRIVYKLTAFVSRLHFKGYGKLTDAQKVEWNNRGFSTFHALFVASASLYLLLLSGLFYEDSRDELVVNRTSTLSNSTLGISIGYFLSDLAMILFHFPALGGLEYVSIKSPWWMNILINFFPSLEPVYSFSNKQGNDKEKEKSS
ncbi:TLC domain-containing protein 4-B isoform X3 [Populus alba x Populus x berolinensis]|uniref:TLC domain-containing protein 4-B isoform X3 n=1 Tax=Populus alba x Populus x berolinensis TaxID=444605 RepID=A0AAD6L8B9_9ROSI|nr:TLC domain-containing protein 4-B isoform X3 [Populus alba x Populus x berolinensis]